MFFLAFYKKETLSEWDYKPQVENQLIRNIGLGETNEKSTIFETRTTVQIKEETLIDEITAKSVKTTKIRKHLFWEKHTVKKWNYWLLAIMNLNARRGIKFKMFFSFEIAGSFIKVLKNPSVIDVWEWKLTNFKQNVILKAFNKYIVVWYGRRAMHVLRKFVKYEQKHTQLYTYIYTYIDACMHTYIFIEGDWLTYRDKLTDRKNKEKEKVVIESYSPKKLTGIDQGIW